MNNNAQSVTDRVNDPAFNTVGVTTQDMTNQPGGVISKKKDTFSITVSPIAFEVTTGTKLLTTIDLGNLINAVFKKVYRDYDGCTLILDTFSARWKANLFFRENINASAEGTVPNIIPINTRPNSMEKPTTAQRFANVTALCSNLHYNITPETTESLTKYYMPWEKNSKTGLVDFKKFTTEQQEQMTYGYNNSACYVCIGGIDVVEILKDIFGAKNDEDHWVDYSITSIRPITQFMQNTPNMLLSIQQLDTEDVKNLFSKIGAIPTVGRIPIIR